MTVGMFDDLDLANELRDFRSKLMSRGASRDQAEAKIRYVLDFIRDDEVRE